MTLQDFLTGILGGSILLGPMLYILFEKVALLQAISSEWKRVAVAVADQPHQYAFLIVHP